MFLLVVALPGVSFGMPRMTRCSLLPGRTLALLRVERDTVLRFAGLEGAITSMSTMLRGAEDSLVATARTPMPAGRVRLLRLDAGTRAILARAGITDAEPIAFIRAAPYRADCRTIRWTDSIPWLVRGDVGFVRATLAPRDQWIRGVPVLVIPDAWNYPYPRRRGLAFGVPPQAPLTPADAMFSLYESLSQGSASQRPLIIETTDSAGVSKVIAWARLQPAAAELEPARTIVRRAVLHGTGERVTRIPSPIRGTYRVTMDGGDARHTWYFRTYDRPSFSWSEADSGRTSIDMIGDPYPAGYTLMGYWRAQRDALPRASDTGAKFTEAVYVMADDRPTVPRNDARTALRGTLAFTLAVTPEALWNVLEAFVPARTAAESILVARSRIASPRTERQPRIPLTLRLAADGRVRGDTTLAIRGRTLRVSLERVDTLSLKRPY